MPAGPGVRVDTAIEPGERVPPEYDNLIAKVMVPGPTAPTAIDRLRVPSTRPRSAGSRRRCRSIGLLAAIRPSGPATVDRWVAALGRRRASGPLADRAAGLTERRVRPAPRAARSRRSTVDAQRRTPAAPGEPAGRPAAIDRWPR